MAIRELLKAHIAFSARDREEVFKSLQNWGCLEIFSRKKLVDTDTEETEKYINKLTFLTSYLSPFTPKNSIFKKLKQGRPVITAEKFKKIKDNTNLIRDYEKLRETEKKIRSLETKIEEAFNRLQELQPVIKLNLKGEMLSTEKTSTVVALTAEKGEIEYPEIFKRVIINQVENVSPRVLTFTYFKTDKEKVSGALEKLSLHTLRLDPQNTPSREASLLKKEISNCENEIKEILDTTKTKYLPHVKNYFALLDYYESLLRREEEAGKAMETDYAMIISAWCPADLQKKLISLMDSTGVEYHLEFEKASAEDNPPVALKNSYFPASFEVVTDLYGKPRYGSVDPTPYLSGFFAFFFGLCLGDAGYGIILTGLSLWSIKFLKISKAARKFMRLILYSGLAAVVAGILSGSWFGDALDGVGVVEGLRIINLMDHPEYFLYFSILLGFIQVVCGQVIAAGLKIKTGRLKDSLYEDLPKIIFIVGASLYIVNALALNEEFLNRWGIYFAGLGIIGLLFFSGHSAKNIFLRPLKGLGNIYGMIDYFKDMVSYSRIFALGMATAILAMAINEISRQLPDMLGAAGYLAIPAVLILGHLVVNLLMSCLSGYVHTSRLQYVEFFTKFFEGGGRSFKAFRKTEKRVLFSEK